jgi:hypothetical protein
MSQERHELGLSVGGGSLQVTPGGGATTVVSIWYQLQITGRLAIEGALDSFNHVLPIGPRERASIFKDDYLGAEVAVVCYLRNRFRQGRWAPFVAAGIGQTSTDFTEIGAEPYYRLGAGVSYRLSDRIELRFEARDEIVTKMWAAHNPTGNLLSARLGISRRF